MVSQVDRLLLSWFLAERGRHAKHCAVLRRPWQVTRPLRAKVVARYHLVFRKASNAAFPQVFDIELKRRTDDPRPTE